MDSKSSTISCPVEEQKEEEQGSVSSSSRMDSLPRSDVAAGYLPTLYPSNPYPLGSIDITKEAVNEDDSDDDEDDSDDEVKIEAVIVNNPFVPNLQAPNLSEDEWEEDNWHTEEEKKEAGVAEDSLGPSTDEESGDIERNYTATRPPNPDILGIRPPKILGAYFYTPNKAGMCNLDHRAAYAFAPSRRRNDPRIEHFINCLFEVESEWGRFYAKGERADVLATVFLETQSCLKESFEEDILPKISNCYLFTGRRIEPTTEREQVVDLLVDGLTLESPTLKCLKDIEDYGCTAVARCRGVMFATLAYYAPSARIRASRERIMNEDPYWRLLWRRLEVLGDKRRKLVERVTFYHYLLKTEMRRVTMYPMC